MEFINKTNNSVNETITAKEIKQIIINKIINDRNNATKLISNLLKQFHFIKHIKEAFLLRQILNIRNNASFIIQRNLRLYVNKKHLNYIKKHEKTSVRIEFPFVSKRTQLKIFEINNQPFKIYELKHCSVTKTQHIYINKEHFVKNKYQFVFIIDGEQIINPDYPSLYNDKAGIYFNIINVSNYLLDKLDVNISLQQRLKKLQKKTSLNNNHNSNQLDLKKRYSVDDAHGKKSPPHTISQRRKEYKFSFEHDVLGELFDFKNDYEEDKKEEINFKEFRDDLNFKGGLKVDKEVTIPKRKKYNTDKNLCNLSLTVKPILRKNPSKDSIGKSSPANNLRDSIGSKRVSFSGSVDFI